MIFCVLFFFIRFFGVFFVYIDDSQLIFFFYGTVCRDFMMNNNNTTMEPTSGGFCANNQTGYGVVSPFSVTDDSHLLLHMYGGGATTADTFPTTADSLTYYPDGANVDCDSFFPRKRSRDSRSNYYHHHPHLVHQNLRSSSSCVTAATTTSTTPFSFLGQDIDISSHINQQQHDIDRFVSLHVRNVRSYSFSQICINGRAMCINQRQTHFLNVLGI